jgi:hypothetical protein
MLLTSHVLFLFLYFCLFVFVCTSPDRPRSPLQLRCFEQLFRWRDALARTLDESPGYILTEASMVAVARVMPSDARELGRAVGRCRWPDEVLAIVREASSEPAPGAGTDARGAADESSAAASGARQSKAQQQDKVATASSSNTNSSSSSNTNSSSSSKSKARAVQPPRASAAVEMPTFDVSMHGGNDGAAAGRRAGLASMFRDGGDDNDDDNDDGASSGTEESTYVICTEIYIIFVCLSNSFHNYFHICHPRHPGAASRPRPRCARRWPWTRR